MSDFPKCCGDCQYYESKDGGRCHINPPELVVDPGDWQQSIWPMVDSFMGWCGQGKKRIADEPKEPIEARRVRWRAGLGDRRPWWKRFLFRGLE